MAKQEAKTELPSVPVARASCLLPGGDKSGSGFRTPQTGTGDDGGKGGCGKMPGSGSTVDPAVLERLGNGQIGEEGVPQGRMPHRAIEVQDVGVAGFVNPQVQVPHKPGRLVPAGDGERPREVAPRG